jgi:hypothetical protein
MQEAELNAYHTAAEKHQHRRQASCDDDADDYDDDADDDRHSIQSHVDGGDRCDESDWTERLKIFTAPPENVNITVADGVQLIRCVHILNPCSCLCHASAGSSGALPFSNFLRLIL